MALTATIHQLRVVLSDVDRGVYETLDLRVARHPSETARYMFTRVLGYALSYQDGIALSKAGLFDNEQPPISVVDPTGLLLAWIDVGSPSAERLHRASKAARRVQIYTYADLALLRKEAATRSIYKVEAIEVWRIDPELLDALEKVLERRMELEVVRTGGRLYITTPGGSFEGDIEQHSLCD